MPTFFGRMFNNKRPDEDGQPAAVEDLKEVPDAAQQPIVVGGNPIPTLPQKIIDKEQVREAATILATYKNGKANLERRVIEDEQWWKLRHWDVINRGHERRSDRPEPTSAWLFNAVTNKHADAMDNYPTSVVLPREPSDEQSADMLTEIMPVVMEYNHFEQTYSDNWWEKLKHGTAVYGVFWNSEKNNGIGDIDILDIDLLKIFWEPGIRDIQKSRNLFICDLVDTDLLEDKYPDLKGKLKGNIVNVEEYIYDDSVDTSDKSLVVDWYYKRNVEGRTILHYCKFVGDEILYSSENDPKYMTRGYYDHGLYPVEFDTLFPEKGTPVGFGYVAICKSPQIYIDKLGANILENSLVNTKPRFFVSSSTNIDVDDYSNWDQEFVKVDGDVSDVRIRPIDTAQMSGIYMDVYAQKIEEMKDTASNRDVNSGGAASGITAASAIAALQEAGNKASRDMISASYRSHARITEMVIELMKQFYDETRAFRIVADNGQYEFVEMNKQMIGQQSIGFDTAGNELFRDPIYDLKIKAQKRSPFSKMEENERAKELYSLGFFAPEKAQESLMALDMMDFEGIDKIKDQVRQGQTLLNLVQQYSQLVSQLTGVPMDEDPSAPAPAPQGSPSPSGGRGIDATAKQAQTPMTAYGQRLAKRSTPSLDNVNSRTEPGA